VDVAIVDDDVPAGILGVAAERDPRAIRNIGAAFRTSSPSSLIQAQPIMEMIPLCPFSKVTLVPSRMARERPVVHRGESRCPDR